MLPFLIGNIVGLNRIGIFFFKKRILLATKDIIA